jgi:hypothetical protein
MKTLFFYGNLGDFYATKGYKALAMPIAPQDANIGDCTV